MDKPVKGCGLFRAALCAMVITLLWCRILPLAAMDLPEVQAEDRTALMAVNISTARSVKSLLDNNTTTKLTMAPGTTLEIALPQGQGIAGIYLRWDKPPKPWRLTWEGGSIEGGQHQFLHEYLALPATITNATLRIGEEEALLCDIFGFSEGALPAWVQVWELPYQRADLLLLPTHADDEHLFFGGTMPYYAGELGRKVQVAYLTHHWAEPYRPHELLNGLWTVGIRHYPVIGPYTDYYANSLAAAKALYNTEAMVNYQVELLRRFRPLVVIGHDIDGEYGHGVHMMNTDTLRQALTLSGDSGWGEGQSDSEPWEVPKTYLHLYKENHMYMNWDEPLEHFDGATAFMMAEKGFACHKSQQAWFSVRRTGVHDCRSFGLYRSNRGPDIIGGDFMEGLAPYPNEGQKWEWPVLPKYNLERYGPAGQGVYFSRRMDSQESINLRAAF